ncbi:MAG: exodeoxyribonuclease VII large subunit [Crocinitomicaceae bacterium]
MSDVPKIFTLQQVVSSIRKTIEERYQQYYWVKAEMHKLNRFASGHCFPELLQKKDGKIVAQIRGTIWNHQFETINKRFIQVVKEPLKEDTTLLMQVKVTFHESYGLSLQIVDIDPNYALGELQRERQETLQKLQKEGLINSNQQLKFPLLPKRVAVISAESSKGHSDFMQVLNNNEWNYSFFTMLFPAYLQGDNAARSIIAQLENIKKVLHHFDLVVIVRGGGGEVGLSCYNDYKLCKAIASFPLPVLTGIGHSTNLTVAEMIAFRNAITPTELGDFLLQAFHNFSMPLKDAIKSIKYYAVATVEDEKIALNNLSKHFKNGAQQSLYNNQQKLIAQSREVGSNVRYNLQHNRQKIERLTQNTLRESVHIFQREREKMELLSTQIPRTIKSTILVQKNLLDNLQHSVEIMDPINVLKRGFSITTINGKTLKVDNKAQKGDEIITKTAIFNIKSTIIDIEEDNE